MSVLDSEAQFNARATELRLSTTCLASLKDTGLKTLGALAFAVGVTPGECTAEEFQNWFQHFNSVDGDAFIVKRLMFEAQTMMMANLQQSVATDAPSKHLPPIERQSRIEDQKRRSVGILIQGDSEPSFELIDLAHDMLEKKSIKYIPPHRCTKRETELLDNSSRDKEIIYLEQGRLTTKKSSLPSTSTNDALKLHFCLLRRALALDLAQVLSFDAANRYHQHLLSYLSSKAPAKYSVPSINQIVNADRVVWTKMAELAGTDISPQHLDSLLHQCMHLPEVSFNLLPRPEQAAPPSFKPQKKFEHRSEGKGPRPSPYSKGKGGGKNKSKSKSKSSVSMPTALRGMNPRTKDQRPKCFDHNLPHGCQQKDGDGSKGDHSCVCWKCGDAKHSWQVCQHNPDRKRS